MQDISAALHHFRYQRISSRIIYDYMSVLLFGENGPKALTQVLAIVDNLRKNNIK